MSYDYDVFLSYRRLGEWPQWVDRQFLPLFRHWLGEELGRKPSIFVDREGIQSGDSWPLRLAKAHSTSRVLVGLWSRTYFESKWCQAELARMLARHQACGIPTPDLPQGLIHAAVLHDGDTFPEAVATIQTVDLTSCASVRVARDSPTAEELESRIKRWVPGIARSISTAPEYDSSWLHDAAEAFLGLLMPKTIVPALPRLG